MVACSSAKASLRVLAMYVANVEDDAEAEGIAFGGYVTCSTGSYGSR